MIEVDQDSFFVQRILHKGFSILKCLMVADYINQLKYELLQPRIVVKDWLEHRDISLCQELPDLTVQPCHYFEEYTAAR
jgi:hypothetical protein